MTEASSSAGLRSVLQLRTERPVSPPGALEPLEPPEPQHTPSKPSFYSPKLQEPFGVEWRGFLRCPLKPTYPAVESPKGSKVSQLGAAVTSTASGPRAQKVGFPFHPFRKPFTPMPCTSTPKALNPQASKPLNPKPLTANRPNLNWVLVKGFSLSYHNKDLWLLYCGNLPKS